MKKILSFIMAVAMLMSLCVFSTVATTENKALYEDVFVEYLRKYAEGHDDEGFDWYDYEELCYYCAESDSVKSTADETEAPDFVLVKARVNMCSPMPAAFVVGDYIFYAENLYVPYAIELYVYTPEDNKIYTLEQAYENYSAVIDKFFAEGYIDAKRLGDMDNDRKITVKDATYIQKCLAGITAFESTDDLRGFGYMVHEQNMPHYSSDFNRDGVRNIKDATAIQKYIAGITGDADEPEPAPFSSNIHQGAEYMDDCILVVLKKGLGHDYTLENFPEYEFSAIEKIGGTDGKGYAIYVLYLENPGKENVVEAIKALDYRAETDLYAAEPDYIYYVWH